MLTSGLVWTDGDESQAGSIKAMLRSDSDADVAVVSLASLGFPENIHVEPRAREAVAHSDRPETNKPAERAGASSHEPAVNAWTLEPFTLRAGHKLLQAMRAGVAGVRHGGANTIAYGHEKVLPKFAAAYRSLLKQVALAELPRIQETATLARTTVTGIASTYNPFRDGIDRDEVQTASGERYDPAAWTAAIQIGLRNQFGGVRYGRLYQPTFALVESGDKQIIVKINDVGPLRPGRVIDLNERSMRYFDPFLERGLVPDVKITLLPGEDWTPGPIGGVQLVNYASAQ